MIKLVFKPKKEEDKKPVIKKIVKKVVKKKVVSNGLIQLTLKPKDSLLSKVKSVKPIQIVRKIKKTELTKVKAVSKTKLKATTSLILKENKIDATKQNALTKKQLTYNDLNEKQAMYVDTVMGCNPNIPNSTKIINLFGSAGTGKTSTQRVTMDSLLGSNLIRTIKHSYSGSGQSHNGESRIVLNNSPSIVIVSFTNKAVENIRDVMPNELKRNCCTIHKLIEYGPHYYTELDEKTGALRNRMKFIPNKGKENKLPFITHCFIEEISSVGTDLFSSLYDALPSGVKFYMMGDINQLQPVMDTSILSYGARYFPSIELTHVYRQAEQSPILKLAYRVLEGKALKLSQLQEIAGDGTELILRPSKRENEPKLIKNLIGTFLKKSVIDGSHNPYVDMVLCPYDTGGANNGEDATNVNNINKYVGQAMTERLDETVYQVISPFEQRYYIKGDIIYFDRSMWEVTDITRNGKYVGHQPIPPSKALTRWGTYGLGAEVTKEADQSMEDLLEQSMSNFNDKETGKVKMQCSHFVALVPLKASYKYRIANKIFDRALNDDDLTKMIEDAYIGNEDLNVITTPADLADSKLGYALTIHKSQGSEWRKVRLVLMREHQRIITRETLYTGITRAKEVLEIFFAPERQGIRSVFNTGIVKQQLKGTGLVAKIKHIVKKEQSEERTALVKFELASKAMMRKETFKLLPDDVKASELKILWTKLNEASKSAQLNQLFTELSHTVDKTIVKVW